MKGQKLPATRTFYKYLRGPLSTNTNSQLVHTQLDVLLYRMTELEA